MQELLAREAARTKIVDLYGRIYPQWTLAKFHYRVGEALDRFIMGTSKRTIINIPPGHVKSMFSSQLAPAKYVGFEPSGQIIGGSYNTELAKKFGREVRNIVAGQDYNTVYPGTWLRKDSRAAGRWNTNRGGSYISAAVNKPVTGNRANRLIIDDPHADFGDGNDLRSTERVWEWFKSLYTRIMPGAGVALIMQRMSTHDLTERFLTLCAAKGDVVEHINFPAIVDHEGNAIKYDGSKSGIEALRKGVALWPEFFTMDVLIDFAKTLGPSQFNAMYQQIPEKAKGRIVQPNWIVHWCRFGEEREGRVTLPKRRSQFDYIAQSWDMRFKKEKSGSFVVGQVWGFFGEYKALLDQVRGQWGFEESCQAVLSLSSKWPEAKLRWIEDKANGPAIENHLGKKLKMKLVSPMGGDKAARMRATESDWSNLTVLMPPPEEEEYEWSLPFTQRILSFPEEPNDEGDATSQALNCHEQRSRFAESLED